MLELFFGPVEGLLVEKEDRNALDSLVQKGR